MSSNNDKVSNNYIPDDVSFIILSKLPLKSVKRFTCTCKSWSLLFQNPIFIKLFQKNFISMHQSLYNDTYLFLNIKEILPYPQEGSTLYLLSDEKFKNKLKLEWPVSFQRDEIYIDMLDSGINDILCFSDLDERVVKLWNPAIMELKRVPPSPAQDLPYYSALFHLHGYGYDHVNGDYKIIRQVRVNRYYKRDDDVDWNYLPTTPQPFWEIYSLKCDSWKRLDLDMPTCMGRKVYLNGFCHWWASTYRDDTPYMVSFDLSNEVFFTTLLPLDMQDSYPDDCMKKESDPHEWVRRYFDLVVLNGFVAMISKHVKTSFHIYVLGELGVRESWTKLFILGPLPNVERLVGAGKKGDLFFIKDDNELACFDLNTQTIDDLGVKGESYCSHFAIYKENFLPFSRIRN